MPDSGNLEEAKKLSELPESCIKRVEGEMTVLVHPMYSANIKDGVLAELNALIKRYSETLDGIPMAYEKVQLLTSHGWLFDANPFAHVRVRAVFYVFAPHIGSTLEGVVKKKSVNHVGCLVHGMFNVSAHRPQDTFVEDWCGTAVQEGDAVILTITDLQMNGFLPYIKAGIDPDCVQELLNARCKKEEAVNKSKITFDDDSGISSNDLEESREKKKKKKKERDVNSEHTENKHKSNSELEASPIKKKKKEKKSKKPDIEDIQGEKIKVDYSEDKYGPDNEIEKSEASKKKKKKKEKTDENSGNKTETPITKESSKKVNLEETSKNLQMSPPRTNDTPKRKKKRDSLEKTSKNLQMSPIETCETSKKRKKRDSLDETSNNLQMSPTETCETSKKRKKRDPLDETSNNLQMSPTKTCESPPKIKKRKFCDIDSPASEDKKEKSRKKQKLNIKSELRP